MLVNLLFNSFGYRIISYILEERAETNTEAKFDANEYDKSKLIEIKIPVNLPYTTKWKDFERYDGEIVLNGRYYKYVKRKVVVDSLILLCIPDQSKFRFELASNHFFEMVNGLKQPLEKKSSSLFKNMLTEYLTKDNYWTLFTLPKKHSDFFIKNSSLISFFNHQKLVKPPAFTVLV